MTAIRRLQWPVNARSDVHVAGLFPLQARGFDHIYRSGFHALHLHEYAGTIRLAGKDHQLQPGTVTLSPANEESSYDLPRPGVHWCIHFDPQPVVRSAACLWMPLVCRLGAAQGEAIRRFAHIARLRALLTDTHGQGDALREVLKVALQELLHWIMVLERIDSRPTMPTANLVIQRLLEHIDRNLGRKFRADELAAQAGFSQNHLARLFRHRTGMTLPRYVLTRRIGLARLLLETTNLPIKQIAVRVGMPDPHHFNKQFRMIAGVSPSDFRAGGSEERSNQAVQLPSS